MNEGFEQDIPLTAITIGFVLLMVLSTFLRKWVNQRALLRDGQLPVKGNRTPSVAERVAANRSWASGEILSTGLGPVAALWTLAIVWNLTFGLSFYKSFSNPEMKTGGLVMLGIFAVLGIVPVVFAVRFTMRQLRFGRSRCCINGKAGVLGETLSGIVRTNSEVLSTGDYTIDIACIESYHTGSGKNRTSHTEVHWQQTLVVPRAGLSSRAGIPFSFVLPDFPPETGYQLSRGNITWNLKIHAPVSGIDYVAMFIVPVFRVEEPGSSVS